MRAHRAAPLAILAILPLLGACASHGPRLEAVGPGGDLASSARYVLESAEGAEAVITLEALAEADAEVDGRETQTVRVTITADNASEDRLRLPLAVYELHDDQGRRFRRVASLLPPGAGGDELVVQPHERISLALVYDLGGTGALSTTGSLTLDWSYRFRGQKTGHETRFLPVRYRYRSAYRRYHYGFGLGFGHYHPYWGWYCW